MKNIALRGGFRCNCGQEFEVICRQHQGDDESSDRSGADAVFLCKVIELAVEAFGGRNLTSDEAERIRSAVAEIEDVFYEE